MVPNRPDRSRMSFAALRIGLVLAAIFGAACGDSGMRTGPGWERVQGVWEGRLRVATPGDSTREASRLRLELVQQDFTFEGYLLRTDSLSGAFGVAAVDTLLVAGGTVSAAFISFQALDPAGGSPAVFEGRLNGGRLDGSVVGGGFSGVWEAEFLY
jgi:hypothetical protein